MRIIILLLFLGLSIRLNAAIINGYAQVMEVLGTILTISEANQANHDFIVGEYVVIMQMQDSVIGLNTVDDINYGDDFYRLKQTDQDGEVSFSPIKYVFNENNQNEIILFSNPFDEQLKIWAPNTILEIKIVDMNGSTALIESNVNSNSILLHLEHLKTGSYFIEVVTDYGTIYHKTIKR